jgi:anion-transporting  ArsA/GET3 family ATPase
MTLQLESARLIIFCGKGGVGKTTLSLAFGLWNANRGRKTVVVTSHPLPELAVTVSLHGLKEKYPHAAANLFVVHIEPREELANKVRQQIPSPILAKAVLSSRIYQSLIEVAPGLKELAFLSRLRQLAERQPKEGITGDFDLLVWDAPATGHFIQTLKVSRNFDAYLSGPFAMAGRDMLQFFSNPGNIHLFPVTTLEEMAVEETIELCGQLAAELELQPSGVICNLASPLLAFAGSEYDRLCSQMLEENPDAADLRFILDRHAIERALFRRLNACVGAPSHIIERKPGWSSDLELLMNLSEEMGKCLGVGSP